MGPFHREEGSLDLRPGSQTHSVGIPCPHRIQWWKATVFFVFCLFCPPEKVGPCWRQSYCISFFSISFVLRPMHRFHIPSHSPLAQWRAAWSSVAWGDSRVRSLGKRHGETADGFPGLGYNTIPQRPFFLRRASLFQGKNNYPALWENHLPQPQEAS